MSGICDGRVVIVTGAGRGLGRAHALAFAAEGAKVVVNDIGAEADGSGGSLTPAQEVVDEIMAAGGEAIVNGDDVSTVDGAERLVGMAIENFGDLHVVLNNAGIVRDRMFANATADEWDAATGSDCVIVRCSRAATASGSNWSAVANTRTDPSSCSSKAKSVPKVGKSQSGKMARNPDITSSPVGGKIIRNASDKPSQRWMMVSASG